MATVRGCTVILPLTLIYGIFKSRQRRIGLMCNTTRTVIIVIGIYCIIQLVFFFRYTSVSSVRLRFRRRAEADTTHISTLSVCSS